MEEKVQVAIIGAGPAGLATSIFLSKNKIHHVLLERHTFPRDKICGDALSGKVVDIIKKADPQWMEEWAADKNHFLGSYGVRFVAPNGKSIDIPFKTNLDALHHAPGFLAKRIDFDSWLAGKINSTYCTLITDAVVNAVDRNSDGIKIAYTKNNHNFFLSTKLVVGAEGDRSIVAKSLSSIRKENNHYCAGLRVYYEGVTGFHDKNFIELHFIKAALPGYVWIFPLPNGGANVGIGMLSSVVSKKKVDLKKILDEVLTTHPALKERFKSAVATDRVRGWGLPLGSKKRKISGDNFILTGDAAALIDPFTGEGIGNAMESGRIAAEVIVSAFHENRFDRSFLMSYDELIYKKLWDELKLSHTMQRLTRYAWLFNFVVNKAARNPLLQETITGMFENLDLRSRLKKPGFYFQLLFK